MMGENVKMIRNCVLILIWIGLAQHSMTGQHSMTDSLVQAYHNAWNTKDSATIQLMVDPEIVYKTPNRMWNGMAEFNEKVIGGTMKVLRNFDSREFYSRMEDSLAWSIGLMTYDYVPRSGKKNIKGSDLRWEYNYIFKKDDDGKWRILMLLYHE